MGFSSVQIKYGLTSGDMIIFSKFSDNCSFKVKIQGKNKNNIVEITASSLSFCYYAISSFLKSLSIKKEGIFTNLKILEGNTKNPNRNLIISLSWMENIIEFPFFNLDKWKSFIEFISELRYSRIDFMQWGCTLSSPPKNIGKFEDEWQLWENQKEKENSWPIPEAYRGLKYQEDGWKNGFLFQPWFFPIKSKKIKDSQEFSVCLSAVKYIPLNKWDTNKKKLMKFYWIPPFIKNEKLFRKIIDMIHNFGLEAGFFTTPRVPCAKREDEFRNYWNDIIKYFINQGIDYFLFETEEGPISFQHHKECEFCQKTYGDIFTGYTKKVAKQTIILDEIIQNQSKKIKTGWILHVPLNGGYGNPPERKEWLNNEKNYIENLKIFKENSSENFTLDYAPQKGEHGINHDFLPDIYYEIFGKERIKPTGYTHAWGPIRAFKGLEVYYIALANYLWNYNPEKEKFLRDKISNSYLKKLSKILYGSEKAVFTLAKYSINNRRVIYGVKSAVCPIVWDRTSFAIGQQILKEMFLTALKEKKASYLPYPMDKYKKVMNEISIAERELKKVNFNFPFLSEWDIKEGFYERLALVKSSHLILKFYIFLDKILINLNKKERINKNQIEKLIKIGLLINDISVKSYKDGFWPGCSRLGGLYDYYSFSLYLKNFLKEMR